MWWERFLALRFIVIGAGITATGGLLAYVGQEADREIRDVGIIVIVAGVGCMALGVLLWPQRARPAQKTDQPEGSNDESAT